MASAEVLAPAGSWTGSRYGCRTIRPSMTGWDEGEILQLRLSAVARCWVQIRSSMKVWLRFLLCMRPLGVFSSGVAAASDPPRSIYHVAVALQCVSRQESPELSISPLLPTLLFFPLFCSQTQKFSPLQEGGALLNAVLR